MARAVIVLKTIALITCLRAWYWYIVESSDDVVSQLMTLQPGSQSLVSSLKEFTQSPVDIKHADSVNSVNAGGGGGGSTTTGAVAGGSRTTTAPAAAIMHTVAGLSCKEFAFTVPDEDVQDMVYWRDIPSDALFETPFKNVGPAVKYLTFEPDEGGWNNIRMAMETAVTMALAMGRILVLPPEQGMYLLGKKDQGQKHTFTFKDFFHFDSVELEHPHLEVISFEDFLKREAMTGHLKTTATGQVSFPPENRTNWDGRLQNFEAGKKGVFPWLRTVTKLIDWDWDKCIAGFRKYWKYLLLWS